MRFIGNIVVIAFIIMGFIFKKKKIKDINFFSFSVPYIILAIYILTIIIIELILPAPTYYIKPKDFMAIEDIIESEMDKVNIEYDFGTVEIVAHFQGKYNQLYFCKYEVQGKEEARMFDFKINIFGNMKPSHDFSESRVVLKGEKDTGGNFRNIGDGFAAFHISYGYANNPDIFDKINIGKLKINKLSPESYYLFVERFDGFGPLLLRILLLIILIVVTNRRDKKETYRVIKIPGKKVDVLEENIR